LKRVAVLISGRGSNLSALIAAQDASYKIILVISNVEGAGGLEKARAAGIATAVVPHGGKSRETFDAELDAALRAAGAELVVLAGFMRMLGEDFLTAFRGRVINIHPALLPAFPGLHVHKQTFDAGVKIAGCTVHFVDTGVDTGPIIAQAAVPVHEDDDVEALRARILAEEHRLLPAVVRAIAEHRVVVEDRKVRVLAAARTGEVLRSI